MITRSVILLFVVIYLQNATIAQQHSVDLLSKMQFDVDSVMNNAISQRAFPGGVVYASHKGKVMIHRAYGYHTYDSLIRVDTTHIYDLASLTKVMGSGLALMKLYEEGLINLDAPLSTYFKGFKCRDIGDLTLRLCLSHQSGLKGWIKFYMDTMNKKGDLKRKYFSIQPDDKFPFEVSEGMYLRSDFYKRIRKTIKKEKVTENPKYLYSGIFFYLVPELVEQLTGSKLNDYLSDNFFRPIEASTLTFNPLGKFGISQIVPTEIDTFFRHSLIHGKVHDEGAILMKGISGNAGLFGSSNDVAKVWEMLIEDGSYCGIEFLKPETIALFTTTQYPNLENRRGLTFDKPLLEYDSIISSVAKSATIRSFGHTGYTGTLAWADPGNDLVFIFLSNRVYPDRNQKKIYELNVRPTIHQLLYDYIDQISSDPCE